MQAIILTKSAMNKDGKKGACTTAYVFIAAIYPIDTLQ